MIVGAVLIPLLNRADYTLPFIKDVLLGILGLFEAVMLVSAVFFFKDAFIIVSHEVEVLPMREPDN